MQKSSTMPQATIPVLPAPLKLFLLLSCGLTMLSFVYTIICRYLNLGLPYSFPYYYVPGDMFLDFFGFEKKFLQWGKPAFFSHENGGYFMYPAPLAQVFHFFLSIQHPRSVYLLFMSCVTGLLLFCFVRVLRKEGLSIPQSIVFVGSTALLSYPLIVLFQRWNIEVLIWLVCTVAVWAFFSGRATTSAVFIGLAAALKLYPIIFLGLFLPRKKYGKFVLGLSIFVVMTLLSLHGLGPTVAKAANWDSQQIAAFTKYYVGSLWALGFDHSFYSLVKLFTLHWHPNLFAWARPFSLTVASISVILYFWRIWHLPLPNQILALSILSVTLAPISYDYTLLNLYPAFAMLVVLALRAEREHIQVPQISAYMVLFAMILTPQSYVIFRAVRYGGQVRALCLIGMLILSLTTPIPERDRHPSWVPGKGTLKGRSGLV